MNILIKLMSIVSLVIAPYIAGKGFTMDAKASGCSMDKMEMQCPAGAMNNCVEGKNCTAILDTTYTDTLGHTIVEKKCIVTGDAAEMPCCKKQVACEKMEVKKECCMKKEGK